MNTQKKWAYRIKVTTLILLMALVMPTYLLGFRAVSTTRKGNLALKGYDTVAYFTEGSAVKGSPVYTANWNGAVWQFSSQTNMNLFKKDPEKYAPEFGGYCSLGISNGKPFSCDSEAFVIVNGKLYILKNIRTREIWLKDPEGYLEKAKQYWLLLTQQE